MSSSGTARELKKWCQLHGIKVIAAVKNARTKLVEGIGALAAPYDKIQSRLSGQNLRAPGPSSNLSSEQLAAHAKMAPRAEEAMAWLRTEQLQKL